MSGYDQLAAGMHDDTAQTSETPSLRVTPQPVAVPDEMTGKPAAEAVQKPRVVLMGEFSAGKSTLSNLLVGAAALPVNVTATQLPPVWISKGDEAPYRVGLDGEEYDIDLNRLGEVSVDDTSHIRIFRDAKILDICDLIDMPGISDPNMAADVWQRMVHHADIVLWCTHATQAWRQSEAAVWATMPRDLQQRSLLLLTRMDRILSERDRSRVIRRVEKETLGLFRRVVPVSLLKALEAGEDASKWEESGAADLSDAMVDLIDEVASGKTGRTVSRVRSRAAPGIEASLGEDMSQPPKPKRVVMPTRVRPRPLTSRTLSSTTSRL
jgi:hypothetical protein